MNGVEHWKIHKKDYSPELLEYCLTKVSIVIATLNEVQSIGIVVKECLPFCAELIIVDGGSKDGTTEAVKGDKIRLMQDNRRGKGDALRVGGKAAQKEVIVFIDADMSHDPGDIPKVVEPIFLGEADKVIASRPKGGSDELHGDFEKFMRMIGSDIITLGINYRFNVRLTDSQNGFRAIKKSVFDRLKLVEDITTIEQEMTMKVLKKGFKIIEVPSHEYARAFGDSHISLFKVSFRYIYSWLKNLI